MGSILWCTSWACWLSQDHNQTTIKYCNISILKTWLHWSSYQNGKPGSRKLQQHAPAQTPYLGLHLSVTTNWWAPFRLREFYDNNVALSRIGQRVFSRISVLELSGGAFRDAELVQGKDLISMPYQFLYIKSLSYHHRQQRVSIRDCSGPTFITIFRVLSCDDANLHITNLPRPNYPCERSNLYLRTHHY